MAETHRPPTIADVASRAGVSIASVSRVLNGSTPVVPETAERIRMAIEELHYVPRTAARILASRRTDTLGLLLPEIGGAFFSPLLRGIEAEARTAGFDLLIHATTHIPHASTPAPHRSLAEHNTDGLLVFTQSIDLDELERLRRINFPVVLLYQASPAGLDIPAVLIENRERGTKDCQAPDRGARLPADRLPARPGWQRRFRTASGRIPPGGLRRTACHWIRLCLVPAVSTMRKPTSPSRAGCPRASNSMRSLPAMMMPPPGCCQPCIARAARP